MPPATLRTGLLAYSAILTAMGSSVALGLLRGPAATALSANRRANSALAASTTPQPAAPPEVAPPTTVPPPPPTTQPPPPPTTSPPTTQPRPVRVIPARPPIRAAATSSSPSVSAIFACIRQKESGDNYSENTGNGYYGAYQFDLGTWQSLGNSGRPDQASPAVQDAAAQKLYSEKGFAPWPVTSRECGA